MKKEMKVIDLSRVIANRTTIDGYNTKLIASKYLDNYIINFSCNQNGDIDTEAVYTFDEPDDYTMNLLNLIFTNGPIISIYDREKNVELEIGLSYDPKVQVYFDLNDYDYDPDTISSPITYNIKLDSTDEKYKLFDLLISLINKNPKKEESVSHEHQSYTIKYERQSKL